MLLSIIFVAVPVTVHPSVAVKVDGWIFRCGGAAVPENWKPPVRNWEPHL